MENFKLGLQVHSVREAFAENPVKTLHRIREMGYTGVEIPRGAITHLNEGLTDRSADFYKHALADADLQCYGLLTSWEDVQPDRIRETVAFNRAIESGFLVIGSVPTKFLSNGDDVKAVLGQMQDVLRILRAEGITTGYHNHDSDFTHVVDGKPFFFHVFDQMPDDFVMLIDTGNAKAGGYDTLPLLQQYPNRSPYLHIKGYSQEKGYLAYIGQDDFDWDATIRGALELGGTEVFDIEFGARGDYDPFERAQNGYHVVSSILKSI